MLANIEHPDDQATTRRDDGAILLSLELSRSLWLVTALLPGRQKLSKHSVPARDSKALLALIERLRSKAARQRQAGAIEVISIQEAGLDGFWLHRLLEADGIRSLVVDPASVAVPRRRRRAKTDAIDGETLLRTLAAWLRGEARVCSMVRPPSPEQEDARRLVREREALVAERTRQSNRIRGLLSSQGIVDYNPLRRRGRASLDSLVSGDGRALPAHLQAELARSLQRLDLLAQQIGEVEAERDAALAALQPNAPGEMLLRLRSLGPQFAAVLWLEGFFRSFANRRQIAAYAGLAPSPWQSGQVDRDQGISKAGNPRLRSTAIELAWLWLRYQPGSALSQWFHRRVGSQRGRSRRIAIVALARKLLVALWRYVTAGVIPEGAVLKQA